MPGEYHETAPIGIILLAAGASKRLGIPKQMLLYKGVSLLNYVLAVAIETGIKPVIAVIGSGADIIVKETEEKSLTVVFNNEWSEGMASSIRCGLQKLLEIQPDAGAVIFMVCDQPFVTTALLKNLVAKYKETGKPIVASSYENNMGAPALFDKTIFAKLMALKGDIGAKGILKENPDWVDVIDFPLGNLDIDTEQDYERLLKLNSYASG